MPLFTLLNLSFINDVRYYLSALRLFCRKESGCFEADGRFSLSLNFLSEFIQSSSIAFRLASQIGGTCTAHRSTNLDFIEGINSKDIRMIKRFFSKAVEWVVDQGLNNALNIKDFDHNLETLRKNSNRLSAQAGDVEEEINIGERSGRKKRKREVEVWLKDVKSIEEKVDKLRSQVESQGFVGFVVRRLMDGGGKLARLNMQVEKLIQQRQDVGEPVLDAGGTKDEILLTNGMVGGAFNEHLEKILELLVSSQVSKISVYGMGGVGKTTLAKHVYNRLVQQSQGRVFWITVSQEFTIRSLQDKIAHHLGVDLSDEDDEAIRAGRLNRFLSKMKNAVLILDDVWEKIDMQKVGCEFSVEFCRLIITTRSLEVCHQIDCEEEIPVEILHAGEAWKLFKETLGRQIELDPEVERTAKDMVKLCGGLPLGIITVAGSMKGETAIPSWKNALVELKECVRGQDDMGEVEEVFKVLKYSFDRLKKRNDDRESNKPNMIQDCFLCCSLYAEDYEIQRDELVGMFISEGLLNGRRDRRAQIEQGHSILVKLVKLCLLESCVSYNDVECVKMHDLVRSMALRICKGKYLVRAGEESLQEIPGQEEWTKDLEKVSLIRSGIRRIEDGFSPNCPKLSTLLLPQNYSLKNIPESFFSKMQGLCILDLCWSGIAMLPDSIGDLTGLKALLLERCLKLESVPYLGKLKALRELNLTATAIEEVPQGLEELLNLRFLSINARKLKLFPKGLLLKLGHLEHLNLPFHTHVEIEEIENLKGLVEFGGGVKSVSDFNRFISTRKVHDTCYIIGVNGLRLAEWRPTKNELELCGSNLKDEKVLGKGIEMLAIIRCEGLSRWFVDDLSEVFDNPTSLKRVIIHKCRGIEWIMRSDDGQGLSNTSLEEIELNSLDDLKGVVVEMERGGMMPIPPSTMQPHAFSSLRRLTIFNCKKMRKMGLQVSRVPNLEVINIGFCKEIQEIFEEEDEGRDPVTTLPKLKGLRLEDLPRLKRVSKATIISNSIEHIYIRNCPELMKKLPLHFDCPAPPPSLRWIAIEREWWDSLDWDTHTNPNLPQLLQPFLN